MLFCVYTYWTDEFKPKTGAHFIAVIIYRARCSSRKYPSPFPPTEGTFALDPYPPEEVLVIPLFPLEFP